MSAELPIMTTRSNFRPSFLLLKIPEKISCKKRPKILKKSSRKFGEVQGSTLGTARKSRCTKAGRTERAGPPGGERSSPAPLQLKMIESQIQQFKDILKSKNPQSHFLTLKSKKNRPAPRAAKGLHRDEPEGRAKRGQEDNVAESLTWPIGRSKAAGTDLGQKSTFFQTHIVIRNQFN